MHPLAHLLHHGDTGKSLRGQGHIPTINSQQLAAAAAFWASWVPYLKGLAHTNFLPVGGASLTESIRRLVAAD